MTSSFIFNVAYSYVFKFIEQNVNTNCWMHLIGQEKRYISRTFREDFDDIGGWFFAESQVYLTMLGIIYEMNTFKEFIKCSVHKLLKNWQDRWNRWVSSF